MVTSFARVFLAAAILCVPAGLVGRALQFGGFAWLVTFVVILPLAALADRDYFYGPRDPG